VSSIKSTQQGDVQTVYYLGRVAEYLGCGDLLQYLDELLADDIIIPTFERAVARIPDWKTKRFSSMFQFRLYRILLYGLVRDLKPRRFVETGVLHGMSSIFILRALDQNGTGMLDSIDMPSYFETGPANQDGYVATLPKGKKVGWLVPARARKRWRLHLGRSREILPKLLPASAQIDSFFHDSEHTYETMWFELNFAWSRLAERGLLMCDNVESNPAFFDFCNRVGRHPLVLPAPDTEYSQINRFALIRK